MGDLHNNLTIGLIDNPIAWSGWTQAKAYLDPALQLGDDLWPDVERDLHLQEKQLWAVLDGQDVLAAAITRIVLTRNGEVAELQLIGGKDFRRWVKLLSDTIAEASRDLGCKAVRAYGRLGWRDILGELGWRPAFMSYEKSL